MNKRNFNKVLSLLVATSITACGGSNGTSEKIVKTLDETGNGDPISVSDYKTTAISDVQIPPNPNDFIYTPVGLGGGGAMSGISMSPYSSLWFVGTDMGTLFRSVDYGKNWRGISHYQTTYSPDLSNSAPVGFSSNPNIVFHAPEGQSPVRSEDAGVTWKPIALKIGATERIRYWKGNSYDSRYMYAATNKGLWQSADTGVTWSKITAAPAGESKGTFLDYANTGTVIYHAVAGGVYKSTDLGKTFTLFFKPTNTTIASFSAGRDVNNVTFAVLDRNGKSACADMAKYKSEVGAAALTAHYARCGYVWTAHTNGVFTKSNQRGGDYVKLSENDSQTIYVAGSTEWIRSYGTKVWRSTNGGASYTLKLNQYNWDVNPFEPWGENRIEYSAVATDVGWWDNGYISFDVNLRKSNNLGGTGMFFLFSSLNNGDFWNAPFTKYADTGPVTNHKRFSSTGLEMTSVYRFKFHPSNPKLGYAAVADIGGIETEDGGKSFRIANSEYNSNYDYAFDPNDTNLVWAATGSMHDYPMEWHAENIPGTEGGVYESHDRGITWSRITPNNPAFNRQFLSIGYDSIHEVMYAGSQGDGVAISHDRGATWEYMNNGFPASSKIIPQIEIDPRSGDAYALLAGDAPDFTNFKDTGIYYLEAGTTTWVKLRKTVNAPADVDPAYTMLDYPTSFAVDFSEGSDRTTLWMVDYENNGNWLATGIWKTTDRGATWNRMNQYTHPTSIVLDQKNPNNVYVNGVWSFDWGNGGALSSKDGGATWARNELIPYQRNSRSTTLDPNDSTKLFYTFFGSGMLYGSRP